MAKFINGANGTFSGKVGSVIGSSWRSIHYLRGLSKKRTKPFSEAQLAQQQRFGLIGEFLLPLKGLIEIGFANADASRATLFNLVMRENLLGAVTGEYPKFTIDFSNVVLSQGSLLPPRGVDIVADTPGQVVVSWNPGVNAFSGHADDIAYLLVYNEEQGLFATTEVAIERSEGQAEVLVDDDFTGQTGHGWLFFTSRDGRQISRTAYAGEVTFA